MFQDLKYLCAYIVPVSTFWAIYLGGAASWLTVIIVFGALPAIELVLPVATFNFSASDEQARSRSRFFDYLLYINIPLVYTAVLWGSFAVQNNQVSLWQWAGWVLSVGIVSGANGINVAHELGHRPERSHHLMAKILLLPALYQHFFIEHNRGHHKHVATPLDPATAAVGQPVYFFWIKSVWGSWLNSWKLERQRLQRSGMPFWSIKNEMLVFLFCQMVWLGCILVFIGSKALLFAVSTAIVGFLLLETVNYIEHYGLQRKQLETGLYEPVLPVHSWNSDHQLGRIFLYELTRHSDHHYKAARKYQVLRHISESPQLPLGYPGSMLVALVPPLWFWLMDKRVPLE